MSSSLTNIMMKLLNGKLARLDVQVENILKKRKPGRGVLLYQAFFAFYWRGGFIICGILKRLIIMS